MFFFYPCFFYFLTKWSSSFSSSSQPSSFSSTPLWWFSANTLQRRSFLDSVTCDAWCTQPWAPNLHIAVFLRFLWDCSPAGSQGWFTIRPNLVLITSLAFECVFSRGCGAHFPLVSRPLQILAEMLRKPEMFLYVPVFWSRNQFSTCLHRSEVRLWSGLE